MITITESKLYTDDLYQTVTMGVLVHKRPRNILENVRIGVWSSGFYGLEFRKDDAKCIYCVRHGENKMIIRTKLSVDELRSIFDDYIIGQYDESTYKAVMKQDVDWIIVVDKILDWLEK